MSTTGTPLRYAKQDFLAFATCFRSIHSSLPASAMDPGLSCSAVNWITVIYKGFAVGFQLRIDVSITGPVSPLGIAVVILSSQLGGDTIINGLRPPAGSMVFRQLGTTDPSGKLEMYYHSPSAGSNSQSFIGIRLLGMYWTSCSIVENKCHYVPHGQLG